MMVNRGLGSPSQCGGPDRLLMSPWGRISRLHRCPANGRNRRCPAVGSSDLKGWKPPGAGPPVATPARVRARGDDEIARTEAGSRPSWRYRNTLILRIFRVSRTGARTARTPARGYRSGPIGSAVLTKIAHSISKPHP